MSSSNSHSPCAACKFLRRKCIQECVFAPYFPPDQPVKFVNVHKVYGASNVAKLLNELDMSQREDAVASLEYEAAALLRDPVYGCVGHILNLHNRLKQVQSDLYAAKRELVSYIGHQAMMVSPMFGFPPGPPLESNGILIPETAHPQEQQQQQMRYNAGFDMPVNGVAFGNQMGASGAYSSPSLGLGSGFDNSYQVQPQQPMMQEYQIQGQLLLQSQQPQQSQQKLGEDN
ncbi:hypothetical protein UlMin_019214 [Ulmus minor]